MKKSYKVKRRIRIYLFIILGMIAFLGYKLYYYIPKIYKDYHEKKRLEQKYIELLQKEEILSSDLIKLKDSENIARYAREKYLYSKSGELIIKIVE